MAASFVLEASGVGYLAGSRWLVRDVSLCVGPGEVLGLIGPNGAGKSTVAKLVAGLLRPAVGSVRFEVEGRAVTGRAAARHLAFVQQTVPPAPGFTAGELVAMGRYPHRGALARESEADRGRAAGAMAAMVVGGAVALGWLMGRWCRRERFLGLATEALALKQALALRGLLAHGEAVRKALARGGLERARAAVGWMVSRPTEGLPAHLVASAAVESVAENFSDSVVAPAAWYLAAGLPGAFGYRAANTLDAMVGYPKRGRFGMVPARLDDVLNLVPARLSAVLLVAALPRAARVWGATIRDAGTTLSPNAGWLMAAMAHGLDVRLEKRGHHVLNSTGRSPEAGEIAHAERAAVCAVVVGFAALGAAVLAGRWR